MRHYFFYTVYNVETSIVGVAGIEIRNEFNQKSAGIRDFGDAIITSGFNLPAKCMTIF